MANITAAPAKFTAYVVRVHREKRSRTLTVGVVRGLAENIIAADREPRIQTTVKADEHLFLMELAASFELIDFPDPRNWPRAARIGGCDSARQRRVDVARANHMQNTNRISSQRDGEVMRQLALDLSAYNIDRGNLQIWDDRPG